MRTIFAVGSVYVLLSLCGCQDTLPSDALEPYVSMAKTLLDDDDPLIRCVALDVILTVTCDGAEARLRKALSSGKEIGLCYVGLKHARHCLRDDSDEVLRAFVSMAKAKSDAQRTQDDLTVDAAAAEFLAVDVLFEGNESSQQFAEDYLLRNLQNYDDKLRWSLAAEVAGNRRIESAKDLLEKGKTRAGLEPLAVEIALAKLGNGEHIAELRQRLTKCADAWVVLKDRQLVSVLGITKRDLEQVNDCAEAHEHLALGCAYAALGNPKILNRLLSDQLESRADNVSPDMLEAIRSFGNHDSVRMLERAFGKTVDRYVRLDIALTIVTLMKRSE